jgi:hypothetical protein
VRDPHSANRNTAPCGKDSSPPYFFAHSVPELRWSAGGGGRCLRAALVSAGAAGGGSSSASGGGVEECGPPTAAIRDDAHQPFAGSVYRR